MKLGEDGKYYFDVDGGKELEIGYYKNIRTQVIFSPKSKKYDMNISGRIFFFESSLKFFYVYTVSSKKTELSHSPVHMIFKGKNKTEERYIFSLEQFKKALEYFEIKFPWSKDYILNNSNLKRIIYFNASLDIETVTIEDTKIFDENLSEEKENKILSEIIKNIQKLEDLSKFVEYYLKSDLNIFYFEEKNFIQDEDYINQHL